jgi:hypothetical protein
VSLFNEQSFWPSVEHISLVNVSPTTTIIINIIINQSYDDGINKLQPTQQPASPNTIDPIVHLELYLSNSYPSL